MASEPFTVMTPCPNSPNCVSTYSESEQHAIAPLTFRGDAAAAKERLKTVLGSFPRAKLITDHEWEFSYTFTSRIFRYVDDVLFRIDPDNQVIHFRSSSRVGYSDLGANRRRMEKIRQAFES